MANFLDRESLELMTNEAPEGFDIETFYQSKKFSEKVKELNIKGGQIHLDKILDNEKLPTYILSINRDDNLPMVNMGTLTFKPDDSLGFKVEENYKNAVEVEKEFAEYESKTVQQEIDHDEEARWQQLEENIIEEPGTKEYDSAEIENNKDEIEGSKEEVEEIKEEPTRESVSKTKSYESVYRDNMDSLKKQIENEGIEVPDFVERKITEIVADGKSQDEVIKNAEIEALNAEIEESQAEITKLMEQLKADMTKAIKAGENPETIADIANKSAEIVALTKKTVELQKTADKLIEKTVPSEEELINEDKGIKEQTELANRDRAEVANTTKQSLAETKSIIKYLDNTVTTAIVERQEAAKFARATKDFIKKNKVQEKYREYLKNQYKMSMKQVNKMQEKLEALERRAERQIARQRTLSSLTGLRSKDTVSEKLTKQIEEARSSINSGRLEAAKLEELYNESKQRTIEGIQKIQGTFDREFRGNQRKLNDLMDRSISDSIEIKGKPSSIGFKENQKKAIAKANRERSRGEAR